MMSIFFQNVPKKKIDMLRLPTIMAPCISRRSINREVLKKTIMEKEFSYDQQVLEEFHNLIDSKELSIMNLGELRSAKVREIAVKLGLYNTSKSIEVLRKDLVNLQKVVLGIPLSNYCFYKLLFLAGQGVCHNYEYKRGQTGGWHDLWCEHLVKLGSKLQACQETVADPTDLLLCMKKFPVLGKRNKFNFFKTFTSKN